MSGPYNLSLKDNRDAREPLWDLLSIALFGAYFNLLLKLDILLIEAAE